MVIAAGQLSLANSRWRPGWLAAGQQESGQLQVVSYWSAESGQLQVERVVSYWSARRELLVNSMQMERVVMISCWL